MGNLRTDLPSAPTAEPRMSWAIRVVKPTLEKGGM
jgi:hypothetical protein